MNLSQDYGWYVSVLGALAPQLPLYLVYLIGSIGAIIRWKRHPRASLFLIVSIAISFVTAIILTIVQMWLPYYLATLKVDAVSISYYFYGLNVIGNLIRALTFVFVLLAVFVERSPAPPGLGKTADEKSL